jgi:hypothetical protein
MRSKCGVGNAMLKYMRGFHVRNAEEGGQNPINKERRVN